MTLKTSSRSINPFWKMLGFTLRKNLGIIVVLCVAALMYCPGSFVSVILDTVPGVDSVDHTQIFAIVIALFAGAVVVGFNIINFTFLYKKSAGDVFHSLPLTRCELLLSRSISGVISTVIPMTVAYATFSILIAFNPWIGNFAELSVLFANTILIVLVCSAFSLIFVVCAGAMFDLAVSLIGVNLAVMLIGDIFTHTLSYTLLGYSYRNAYNILYNLSIPYFCYRGLEDSFGIIENGINAANIEFYIRSVIYIVIFAAIAAVLYNCRKAEKGGTAYAYKFMYLICSVLAGICGGYVIGIMFGYEPNEIYFWIFMGLGALLCSTVYGVISNRGFKQVWRSVVVGGVAVAVSVIVAIIGVNGAFGYETRVPEKQSVEKVTVEFWGESFEFENPDTVISLHSSIIDEKAANNTDSEWDNYIQFEYQLKNGKTMRRAFYITTEPVSQQLLDIYTDTTRIDEYIEIVKADKYGDIVFNISGEKYETVILSQQEAIEFLEAYKKDLKNCDSSILSEDWIRSYDFSGGGKHSGEKGYYYFYLAEYEGFTNVQQYINDLGILS